MNNIGYVWQHCIGYKMQL